MSGALLVVYDVETTGTEVEKGDDVIQLASLLHVEGTDETYESNDYANPGRPIPPGASEVNHITDDMVADAPPSADVVRLWWQNVVELARELDRSVVLAGHNTDFDRRFLEKHTGELDVPQICTFRLAYRRVPEAPLHKLEFLYKQYLKLEGRGELQAHDAMADVIMCFDVLRHWADRGYLELAEWMARPVELAVLPIGKPQKGRGKPFDQVEYGFLKWMRDLPTMNPDIRHSARMAMQRKYAQA